MSHKIGNRSASALLRTVPLLAAFAAGCGGAGVPGITTGGTTGTPTTSAVGNAHVTFTGTPKAMIAGSSGQVGYVSQAGASYSFLGVNPTPNLNATYLAYTRSLSGSGDQIYTASPGNGWQPNLLVHQSNNGYPTVSQYGQIAYLTQTGGVLTIKMILPDGTQMKTILSNVFGVPSISPNGSTIAYGDQLGNIYTIPSGGGTSTKIYAGANALSLAPVWSPNSSQIAFTATPSGATTTQVFTMPANGGTATNVTPATQAAGGNTVATGWSPDGQTLACNYSATGGSTTGVLTVSLSGGYNNILTPATFSDSTPVFSPDGQKIAFYRTNAGGATPGIYVEDFAGANPQLVIPDPSASGATGPVITMSWSLFPIAQKFVGPGGTFTTNPVSGFVLTQNGSQFGSLLTMAATTPSTAKITPTQTTPGGPIYLTLQADAITNVIFTNVYNGSHTNLALTTTPTAVVSIDGSTGLVDFVAPGRITRRGPPAIGNGKTQLTGQFTAIYDGSGKNIAPAGATSIDVDGKCGKLISFR